MLKPIILLLTLVVAGQSVDAHAHSMKEMHMMEGMDMSKPSHSSKDPAEPKYIVKTHIVKKAADLPKKVKWVGGLPPFTDKTKYFHGIFNQLEGRYRDHGGTSFRWDGELWAGGDYNRLLIRSEGTVTGGKLYDGTQEFLYSRAISTYFNLVTGVRTDLDSNPTRTWFALGVEGLSLYEFEVAPTFYVGSDGRVSGKLEGWYDIPLTNRLILQPQAELDFYSKNDRARGIGHGLSDIDAGIRIRYEFSRKFAPYLGAVWDGPVGYARKMFNRSKSVNRWEGTRPPAFRFTFGMRTWF